MMGLRCIVLSVHDEHLPELQAENEIYASYVPFKKLLPLCAAMLHGGGIGTIAQVLAAGLPQLIVPFVNDQHDNGYRLHQLGVALHVPLKKWTDVQAIESLKQLLNSREIKLNCEQFSKKIDFEASENQLCEVIERCFDFSNCNGIMPNEPGI